MSAMKKSAGVALDVDPKNLLQTGDKARKRGIYRGFETQSPEVKSKRLRVANILLHFDKFHSLK